MKANYYVTTMGSLASRNVNPFPQDDDIESGMLNEQFTMASLRGDEGLTGSEEGTTSGEDTFTNKPREAIGVEIPDDSFFDTATGVFTQATGSAQTTAEKLLNLVRGGGGGTTPGGAKQPSRGGGGGGGGGGLVPQGGGNAQIGAGMFGDLFGEHTDAIVIGVGLLAAAGLGWMLMTHKPKATGKRAR